MSLIRVVGMFTQSSSGVVTSGVVNTPALKKPLPEVCSTHRASSTVVMKVMSTVATTVQVSMVPAGSTRSSASTVFGGSPVHVGTGSPTGSNATAVNVVPAGNAG